MKKNQGHARCFATGLKFIIERENFDYVIPMDADGEDRPEELSLFFNKLKEFNYNGPFIMQAYRDDDGIAVFKAQLDWVNRYF